MKYLIVGTGGVGGSIAGFLAQAGRDVTCIARGAHLEALSAQGLTLESDIKDSVVTSPVKCHTAENYIAQCRSMTDDVKPDVIIVAVKGYSLDSIAEVVREAAASHTLVIPILNVYGTGQRLASLVGKTKAAILDGCVYIVAYRKAPGIIRQMGRVLKVVMGSSVTREDLLPRMQAVASDMQEAGIKVVVSEDIRKDTFMKWGFISAMAATGAYFDCPMGPLQVPGMERETLTGLLGESLAIGRAMGLSLPDDYVERNVDIIDHCTPDTTSSMQKDMAGQHQSEIDGQLFSMADLGHSLGLSIPVYDMVCEKFKSFRTR